MDIKKKKKKKKKKNFFFFQDTKAEGWERERQNQRESVWNTGKNNI